MRKKYIVIALGILSLLAVAFLVIKIRQTGEAPSIIPSKPDIPNYITGKLPIEVLVKKEDFNFPSQLPILSISRRGLNKEDSSAFAEKLGLGVGLNEFEDINEGIKYYANSDKYFFVATPKTSIIKFGLSSGSLPLTAKKGITDEEFTRIALSFLTENGFYSENQVKALPVVYLRASSVSEGLEETERTSAGLFQVGFVFSSSEYEILTDNSASPQIFVQVLPDGAIYNAEILLINSIQKGLSDYPLKGYEDLLGSLDQAKLIALTGDYIAPSDLTINDVVSLKVEKIKLVYFLEKGKEDILQPIFVLEGPAVIRNSSANSATVYLPAYK